MPIDTNGLINDARCVANCVPVGMQMAVLISLAQQIISNGSTGGGGGSGAQTPWTSDIDAAGFNLTDVGTINGFTPGPAGTLLPAGVIIMWSGNIAAIPSGWALCDGTAGTPDLRDKFIIGAGSTYGIGNTGGTATHDHGGNTGDPDAQSQVDNTAAILNVGSDTHQHSISSASNIPPFYALAYIIKV